MNLRQVVLTIFLLCSSQFAQATEAKVVEQKILKTTEAKSQKTPENRCEGSGPQTPRDIDKLIGKNKVLFTMAPEVKDMQLCNVHFHRFAENKSSKFSTFVQTGNSTGWACKKPLGDEISLHDSHDNACSGVESGDTIEVHWVYTSCDLKAKGIARGAGLKACTTETCANPQLRVEAEVFLLTKEGGMDFTGSEPSTPEESVLFAGSTTGPQWNNNNCSPLQVTWNVRKSCHELNIESLHNWCLNNQFGENHGHGVRKLVTNEFLLSKAVNVSK